MNGRLRLGLLALVTVALAAISIQPQTLKAQEASARFRVLVPDVPPQNDASKKFGERLADELRDLINDMATHQPVEEKEIKDALKRFDMKMEDLNCIRTRQLGQQIQAELVFCGTYTREGEGWRVEGSFVGANGEALEVEPVTVEDRGQLAAAQHFFSSLELLVEQVRYAQFCGDYASSQQWETALENCERAIELNPNTVESRYTRAMVLRQEEVNRLEEALEEFRRVLELDPLHEDAMQNAGYVSALMGNDEEARAYYSSYLELNPANAGVRMGVAYQLAQAGDPLGAMQLIEVGLELEPENVDLLEQHGGFAFAAGAELAAGQEMIPVEAAELYQKALQSFSSVYDLQGDEMDVAQLRSIINAHLNLQQFTEAVAFGERILETHGEEAQVWSVYADALQRADRVDEAIESLERVRELDPEYPNVSMRQGNWLLNSGRVDDAMPVFREAIQRGEQSPDAVVNLLFSNGYNDGVRAENWDYGIRVIRLTQEFDASPEIAQRSLFWLGYSLYRRASVQQEPQTLETASATLPQFQQALGYLREAASYAQANNLEGDRQNLLNATNTYIEIQEAIIRRGR
jgi:tetratricopeptide (TPR) repeat protein